MKIIMPTFFQIFVIHTVRFFAALLIVTGLCLSGAEVDPPWWPWAILAGPVCLGAGMLLAWYSMRWQS